MFQESVVLAQHSNYKIGGPARYFFEAQSLKEVRNAVEGAHKERLPLFILGGGTNILFDDAGFDGLVLKPNLNYVKLLGDGNVVIGAGTPVADLLNFTIEQGLSGLEWAGGLPGTVGGAIRGNAGCFGGEIKDVVQSVSALRIKNQESRIKSFTNTECKFGYRDSVFKHSNDIVLEATFALKKGDKKAIRAAIEEKVAYRAARHPMEYPNIGSIFKNVALQSLLPELVKGLPKEVPVKTDPFPVVPVAYLISETGLKGVSCGGAMISPKHPNFIVNTQSATAAEVKSLIALAKHNVKNKFGIVLNEEVQIEGCGVRTKSI